MLIRLTNSFPVDPGSATFQTSLYDATRRWWKVSASRTEPGLGSPEYAVAVHGGIIRAVYKIDGWERAPDDSRFGFFGSKARDLAAQYNGADVSSYFPKGAVNPIRFVNYEFVPQTERTLAELHAAQHESFDDRRAEILAVAEELNDEPLAHIMYGGRELFHSNLLAWFANMMPQHASTVFDRLHWEDEDGENRPGFIAQVKREEKHLDLVLRWDDKRRPMVLENKVFSLPDLDQLHRYAKQLSTDPALHGSRQVLLSLQDPGWEGDIYDTAPRLRNGRPWRRVSYYSLGQAILHTIPNNSIYESQTITRYAQMVISLQRLADLVAVRHAIEPIMLPMDLLDSIGDQRLFASLSKLRARGIAMLMQQELRHVDSEVEISSGFSNGAATISAFHCPPGFRRKQVLAGWQVQGSSFRRHVILGIHRGKSKSTVQARMDWAAAHPEVFSFAPIDDILETGEAVTYPKPKAGKSQGFNQYNPDFVYRSKKTPDLTVDQLIQAAKVIRTDVTTQLAND